VKYKGSKDRIAKFIAPIVLADRRPNQVVCEPFVGGANFTAKISGIRICGDVNECLVFCLDALSKGWNPPKEISREFYNECRSKYNSKSYTIDEMKVIGYVGINGSYSGRYYDGGYAGVTTTKNATIRNYPLEAYNNVMSQVDKLKGVHFSACDYKDLQMPEGSIIYCDPPYAGTKEYIEAKKAGFCSDEFWQWCRDKHKQGYSVFVSEYAAPDDFNCVWEKAVTSSLRANSVVSGAKKSIERLFVVSQ
jgi:DNA adenine methylase